MTTTPYIIPPSKIYCIRTSKQLKRKLPGFLGQLAIVKLLKLRLLATWQRPRGLVLSACDLPHDLSDDWRNKHLISLATTIQWLLNRICVVLDAGTASELIPPTVILKWHISFGRGWNRKVVKAERRIRPFVKAISHWILTTLNDFWPQRFGSDQRMVRSTGPFVGMASMKWDPFYLIGQNWDFLAAVDCFWR